MERRKGSEDILVSARTNRMEKEQLGGLKSNGLPYSQNICIYIYIYTKCLYQTCRDANVLRK